MGFLERRGKEVEHAHPRGTKYFLAAKLKLQEAFEARIRAAGDIPYGPGSEAFKRSL